MEDSPLSDVIAAAIGKGAIVAAELIHNLHLPGSALLLAPTACLQVLTAAPSLLLALPPGLAHPRPHDHWGAMQPHQPMQPATVLHSSQLCPHNPGENKREKKEQEKCAIPEVRSGASWHAAELELCKGSNLQLEKGGAMMNKGG